MEVKSLSLASFNLEGPYTAFTPPPVLTLLPSVLFVPPRLESPYYKPSHLKFRGALRSWIEEHILPHCIQVQFQPRFNPIATPLSF